MKKLGLALIASVGLTVAFSGCFLMRTLTYSDDAPKAGKTTKAKISVAGQTGSAMMRGYVPARRGDGDEYPFFFTLMTGAKVKNGGKFDTKGVFDGPVKLVKDDGVTSFGGERCSSTVPPARGLGDVADQAVVTKDPFVATNERRFMQARLPIRASTTESGAFLAIFMGTWYDDGDGVAEDPDSTDDAYDCQPPYTSILKIKGATEP